MNKKKKIYQAIAIDYNSIFVICPNKACKQHIHIYPSNLNIENRNQIFKSICKPDHNADCCIRIDDTTSRITLTYYSNKSITMSRRKFNLQSQLYEPHKVATGNIKKRHGNFIVKFK